MNRERFPGGVEGTAAHDRRFHDAGFRVGLHLLAASIYPPARTLRPCRDDRLVTDAFATLTADIDEKFRPHSGGGGAPAFPAEDGATWGPAQSCASAMS